MELENHNIRCNTFGDVEKVIKKAEAKIKEPKSTSEKRYYAQDILLEAETLLSCPDYKARNSGCVNCRFFAHRYIRNIKIWLRPKEQNWQSAINE